MRLSIVIPVYNERATILKRGIPIHEVPIRYQGRSFAEGKKISWKDFFQAVWTLLKHRF